MAEIHDWDEQQRILLQRWPALDPRALSDTKGDRQGILALLEGRLGYARANAERDYDELMSGESSVPKDVADDKQHTGTSGPVGDAHGSFDEQGKERADTGKEGMTEGVRGVVEEHPATTGFGGIEQGQERPDMAQGSRGVAQERSAATSVGGGMQGATGEATKPGAQSTTDPKLAEEYAEGEQGAAGLESDNSDGKTVPPDMVKDEGSGSEQIRRAS
jgi:hypothetical protein